MENKINILDYLSLSTLEMILDTYSSEVPDTCLAINDLNENIVVFKNFHPICSNFHRTNAETEKLCKDCNMYITKHLHEKDYIEYKCGNGLVDIAFPIKYNNLHIGTFYIGQFFIEGDETDILFFENHASKYGFPKNEYLKVARTIKTISRKNLDQMVKQIKADILDLIAI